MGPKPKKIHRKFAHQYKDGGSIEAAVVTPPSGVPEYDTIRLLFDSKVHKRVWGSFMTTDEALATAGVLIAAVHHAGSRTKIWPKR